MVEWNIQKDTAYGLLTTASTDVGEFAGKFTTVGTSVTSLHTALANSSLVSQAVTTFDTDVIDDAQTAVTNRAGGAVKGTRRAVDFYAISDYDMAAQSQQSAAKASTPPELPKPGAHRTFPGHEPRE